MLLLLLILMTASTVTWAEVVRRTLVSQNYETAQTADWRGDAGASITLATGDAVNGTCVQIESTEGNSGVYLPVQLPDEVFYRDQQMEGRGWVAEFDFMIQSGNVSGVSQSQFFLLTQGEYPYYSDALEVDKPSYYGLNAGGQVYTKKDGTWGWSLSQPVRDASTFSNAWYDCSLTHNGSPETLEGDKWYHIKLSPQYVKEGQYPGFWMEYTVWEKETNTYLYSYGSRINSLVRLTGFSALVGQGGMLKFDNLWVYDYKNYDQPVFELVEMNGASRTYVVTNPNYDSSTLYYTNQLLDEQPPYGDAAYIRSSNKQSSWITVTGTGNLYAYVASGDNDPTPSAVTVQSVSADIQTLMAPFHWPQGYDADANACGVYLESDQSWLDYVGDNMPVPTIMYAIDGGEYQPFVKTITVPIGSQLSYYATLEGYNDSPVVAVTAGIPFWEMGMQDQWWADFGWVWNDKTPIRLGEEVEDGLFKLQAYSSVLTDHLLTPNENINDQFMIRNYSPDNGKVANSRRTSPKIEMRKAMPEKVIKKSRNLEEIYIQGIYSGDDRLYGVPDVVEGAYIMLEVQSVENMAVVTAVEGCEVDLWNSQRMPEMGMYVLKVTATGTAKFTVNSGTAIRYLSYYEPAPPQAPYFSYQSMEGANRTYNIYGNGATEIYYTTVPADEQPALDSDAWTVASGSSVQATFTGKGYIYAYAKNPYGTSDVTMQYVNGVALTMSTPYIYSKYYDSDTQLWSVNLYVSQVAIEGVYPNATIYYSIDGGEYTEYTEAFTIANGQQLSYYAKAGSGFQPSPTVTCTAGPSIDELNLQSVTWESFYESPYVNLTLGEERTDVPGFCQIMNGDARVDATNDLLTTTDPIDGQLIINSYGLRNEKARTYAIPGLTHEHYLYIHNYSYYNDYDLNVTAVENLEYDGWNSTRYQKIFKVLADGVVKFRLEGSSNEANTIKTIQTKRLPQWGYIETADANGNTLKYYYENAESGASFYGITGFANDETKAGHIIIADEVTDAKGNTHSVTAVRSSLDISDKERLKSVVFGQNIKSIGNSAFYNCQQLESVTLNSNLETLGSYTFQNCYKLATVNLQDTKVKAIPYQCFYRAGLTEINIPATITEIGSSAFYGCDSVVTITVNTATIPANCFQPNYSDKCKLTTINIGKNVKSIGNYAFQNQIHVTSLNIDPEVSGLTIGNYAFDNLDALTTLTLPEGVTSIGNYAFRYCEKLETVTVPASVTTFGTNVFNQCSALKTVTFAEGSPLTEIPEYTFYYCQQLETVTLPTGITTLGTYAFRDCTSLTELILGEAFTTIGSSAVDNLSSLQKVVLPGVNYPFTYNPSFPSSVTIFVHPDMVGTYKKNSSTSSYHIVPIGSATSFDVTTTDTQNLQKMVGDDNAQNAMELKVTGPLTGTDINYIHANMPYLEVLDLTDAYIVEGTDDNKYNKFDYYPPTSNSYSTSYPTKANVIGQYMFYNMPKLKRLLLPSGATTIEQYAIAGYSSYSTLTEVVMPTALTSIGNYAFSNCRKLVKADIPATVTSIGSYAFNNCYALKTVVIPDAVTKIEQNTFANCSSLTSVTLPAALQSIGSNAFYYCQKLATAMVIPATCTSVGTYAFQNCYAIPSITFNEGLTTIGSDAFQNCQKVETVTLPASLTSLGNSAFSSCTSLKSFTFPANIKQVPSSVLSSCTALEEVTLAEGTTQIGSSAFSGCSKLATVNNLVQATLTEIGSSAFYNTGLTAVNLSGCTALTKVNYQAFYNCKALVTAVLPNTVTTLGGSIFYYCTALQSVNVPTSISTVPDSYCNRCTSLTSVAMHDGIRKIGSSAFYNCEMLETLDLNDEITRFESSAFYNCKKLQLTQLPSKLEYIGSNALANTESLTGPLTLPTGLKTLGSQAFYNSGLTGVVIPTGITSFSSGVFQGCKSLASVTLPADMTVLPENTFYECESLTTIALPATLTTIRSCAFEYSGLTTIDLSTANITDIGSSAFAYSKLTELILPKSVRYVGSDLATGCKNLKKAWMSKKLAYEYAYYNSDYYYYSNFDYFYGCTALETLRLYAGTPPADAYQYYLDYRQNCVLEVPMDAVEVYRTTSPWSEFKDIVGFESSDELGAADFALMKDLYNRLGGAAWKNPWNVTNNLHTTGKWHGVTTVVDEQDEEVYHIAEIDLTEQGLAGPLPKSLFTLPTLTKINLSHNTIEAKVDTMLTDENTVITELNMEGNHLKGDLYPFVSKLPNLTKLNVGYNWLTAYSQPTSNTKLTNGNMYRGYQFVDWATKAVNVPEELMDEVVIDFTPGTPIEIQSNTLQTYRHEAGDYNLSFSSMYRLYKSYDYLYTSDTEIVKGEGDRWDIYSGSLFKAPKGLVAYTHTMPYYSYITYIFRVGWKDGDVNADQTVDVADLQNVVYYALNEQKPNGQVYNYTAADMNGDNTINVSDIVGTVGAIMNYDGDDDPSGARIYNKVETDGRNTISTSLNSLLIANVDEVAALQLTISGARSTQLQLSGDLKSRFTVSMRDVADGVRVIIYSPMGNTLAPGESLLLSGLPAGATVTDARLVGAEANRLSVSYGNTTSIDELMADDLRLENTPIYDLSGRRVGKWNTLPHGIYIVNLNGKQFKVRK